jgi:hypothetical protein
MMPDAHADNELFVALSAINITGPDDEGHLWVSFKPNADGEPVGALSITAESVGGRAAIRWRDMQAAALAKAAPPLRPLPCGLTAVFALMLNRIDTRPEDGARA